MSKTPAHRKGATARSGKTVLIDPQAKEPKAKKLPKPETKETPEFPAE